MNISGRLIMVIFCTNCGTKLDDEDAFCMNCGTKVYDGFKKDKNSSSASIGEDNIYIKNVDLLTRNGIGGHMYRGDFIEFLKKRNLSFDNDLITQKIVDDYFAENTFLKNDVLKNKQKSFRNVADYNVNLLKENGFGGASERGGFITFMKSIRDWLKTTLRKIQKYWRWWQPRQSLKVHYILLMVGKEHFPYFRIILSLILPEV